ncbi:CaiF/GrlA family transcriptional regulator [Enterobacter ludwigii]|uniref:CaiF/GrlA family transcriptional regulator n=1 Tax=Enterobacter ludwigii TaxID=299767 RepID=UPI003BEEDCEA
MFERYQQSALPRLQPAAGESRPSARECPPSVDGPSATVVAGRQSNHGHWTLPASLAGSGVNSLWLAVATWALRAGRPVTREDVAQAFRISARRAADVITYLLDTRSDVVTCEREVIRVGSGHRVGLLRVTAVADATAVPSPGRAPEKNRVTPETRAQEASELAAARALFLGQRTVQRAG